MSKQTNKKRLYDINQNELDIIKEEMRGLELKANNTRAVQYAVYVLARMIKESK